MFLHWQDRFKHCFWLLVLFLTLKNAHSAEWDNSPDIYQVNRMTPHAVMMPYNTIEEAKAGERRSSTHYFSLSGTWKFYLVDNPSLRSDSFYQDTFDASTWDDITVPGSSMPLT